MKNALSVVVAGFTVALLSTSTAFAWTYGLSGTGVCLENGKFEITWTVDNSTENEPLDITASNRPSVVPVGQDIVPANQAKDFKMQVDGTIPADYKLELTAHWDGDSIDQTRDFKVKLKEPCPQPTPPPVTPVTPPTGGMGGGSVSGVSTVKPVPVGPVNAGSGISALNLAAVAGLGASVLAVALGVARRDQKA